MRLEPTSDPQLVLVRHGATAWSRTGQYTGRTDVPLLPDGEAQAKIAAHAIGGYDFAAAYTSPLQRARHTAALVGYPNAIVDEDLLEWDYGPLEGLTPAQANELAGHDFEIFTDGLGGLVLPTAQPERSSGHAVAKAVNAADVGAPMLVPSRSGETLEQVAARAARFIERAEVHLRAGSDVLVVAHGHLLRVLTMVWLGLDPKLAGRFELGTAAISLLGYGHGRHTLEGWNLPPQA